MRPYDAVQQMLQLKLQRAEQTLQCLRLWAAVPIAARWHWRGSWCRRIGISQGHIAVGVTQCRRRVAALHLSHCGGWCGRGQCSTRLLLQMSVTLLHGQLL
ncbi:uncharacterized protein Dmoj_GI26892 [Drosophila mojavensis]|uniref:Uncharacterized protein n=1 Tax=Drosophila mojavensis TaxID=7230 RepID=A0A0Q9XI90_DROMO|nr:uncharacterized protein Dmoj_GI26892 [Drosophila mojavensis]